jgi:hypothetical protein
MNTLSGMPNPQVATSPSMQVLPTKVPTPFGSQVEIKQVCSAAIMGCGVGRITGYGRIYLTPHDRLRSAEFKSPSAPVDTSEVHLFSGIVLIRLV